MKSKGWCLAVIAVGCVSCGDDPELLAKHDRQKAEIERLQGELEMIREQVRNLPPDASADLEEAGQQEQEQKGELEGLEKEVAELAERRREMQAEFDRYRAKYQVK